jgi:RNA polymerase sigma-70 factor (ECF subfamily)
VPLDAALLERRAVEVRDLYREYGRIVYAAAHRVLRHDDLAEEATADTFVLAAGAAERGDQHGDAAVWLAGIAGEAVTEIHRREQPSTVPDLHSIDAIWRVRRAIDKLSRTEATIVRFVHLDGLTHTKIASRLGLSVATVRSRSRRAHLQLARAWRASSDA